MENLKHFHQPTISESLGNGWYVMKKYFLWLLLVVVICSIFDGPAKFTYKANQNFTEMIGFAAIAAFFAIMIFFLVRPVISFGASLIYLECVRDKSPDLKNLFIGFQRNYLNIVLANLLVFIIVVFGLIFLIVPGIIFACRLAFVPYLVMDKDLDPVKAVEESWRLTRGYGWTIFGMGLLCIPIIIVGLICLIIGIFPAIIFICASFASLYQAVEHEKMKKEEAIGIDTGV
jgi:uncharacterized membrane protein